MVAPPAKPRFESGLFTNNAQGTQQKLDACLASDPAHIQPGANGPEIAIIQAALGQIRALLDARIPEITDPAGVFGRTTRTAVHVYKDTRDIRLPGRDLDDIVGRRTISFLDTDVAEIEGVQPTPPPPPSKFKDVVVQILGFGGINSPVQGQRQGSNVLRQLVASVAYNNKTNRSLEAIVFTGGQAPDPTQQIASLVRTAILSSNASAGLVCLTGESAGGKNVLALANELANRAFPVNLAYVGVSDGAFSDADAVAAPNFKGDNLLIRSPIFAAAEKRNIFQSAGNGTEFSGRLLRSIWAGKMPNKEVHGPVQGFEPNNRDLTTEGIAVAVGPNTNFETLHGNAATFANADHLVRIRALLDKA